MVYRRQICGVLLVLLGALSVFATSPALAAPELDMDAPYQLPLRLGSPYPVRATLVTQDSFTGYLELRVEFGRVVTRQPVSVGQGRYEFWLSTCVTEAQPVTYNVVLCDTDGDVVAATKPNTFAGFPASETRLTVVSVGGASSLVPPACFQRVEDEATSEEVATYQTRVNADVAKTVAAIRALLTEGNPDYAADANLEPLTTWLDQVVSPSFAGLAPSQYQYTYYLPSDQQSQIMARVDELARLVAARGVARRGIYEDRVTAVDLAHQPQPARVPAVLGGWTGIDAIIWYAGVPASLSVEQQDALSHYVRQGGRLILAVQPGEVKLHSPVPELLSDQTLTVGATGFAAPELNDGVWETSVPGRWHEASVGFGRLVLLAATPAEVASWDRVAQLSLLGRRDSDADYDKAVAISRRDYGAAAMQGASTFNSQFKEQLVRESQNDGPPLLKLAIGMGVYLVALIICIVVVRLMGRPLLLWLALPLLAMVFAMVAVPMFRYHADPTAERPLTVVDVAPDERTVRVQRWQGMRNPGGSTYSATVASRQQVVRWTTETDTQYAPESLERPAVMWQRPDGTVVEMASYLGAYHFLATSQIDDDYEVDLAQIPEVDLDVNGAYHVKLNGKHVSAYLLVGDQVHWLSPESRTATTQHWFEAVGGQWSEQYYDSSEAPYLYSFGGNNNYYYYGPRFGSHAPETTEAWTKGVVAMTGIAAERPAHLKDMAIGAGGVRQHLDAGGIIVIRMVDDHTVHRYFLPGF